MSQTLLSHQVETRMRNYILERKLSPGDALPSEAEIASTLGVSKSSVRAGIQRLQALGVVDVRHGRGLFVGKLTFKPIIDHLPYALRADEVHLAELLQVRQALEVGLVSAVIPRSSDELFDKLETLVTRMYETEVNGIVDPETDRAFHRALFEPLGNPLVLQLIEVFWQAFTRATQHLPQAGRHTAADHEAIVDALRAGEPEAARRAMQHHFVDVEHVVGLPGEIPDSNMKVPL